MIGAVALAAVVALGAGAARADHIGPHATACNLATAVGGGAAGVSPGPTFDPPNALGWDVGSGQCNGSFTLTDDASFDGGHIELGLRAEQRSIGQVGDNGGGDYTVELGPDPTNSSRAWWNFQASIAYSGSIGDLDALTLTIVTDRGAAVPAAPQDLLAIRGAIDDRQADSTPTSGFTDLYQLSQNPLFGWLDACDVDGDCTVGTCTTAATGMCLAEEGAWKLTLAATEGADTASVTVCIHTPGTSCCGDRFVDTAGSDASNACDDSGSPCATIQHAVDEACAGDTIFVAAGTYAEPSIHVTTAVTIIGDDPATTFVETTTGGAAMFIDTDDVTVRDLTIQPGSGSQGVRFEMAFGTIDDTELDNLHILDHSSNGIEIHNNTTVTDLRIVDCTIARNSTGLRMSSSSTVDGLTVTGTTFDTHGLGIYQANDGSTSTLNDLEVRDCTFLGHTDTAIFAEEITNSVIEDNDFTGNRRGFTLFKAYAGGGHPDVENLVIRGNTFTDTVQSAILPFVFGSGLAGTGITIEDNTIDQNATLMNSNFGVIDIRLDTGFAQAPVTVSGNTVTYSGSFAGSAGASAGHGIKVRGALGSVVVTGNVLDGGSVGDDGGVPPTSGIFVQTDDATFGPATGTVDINCNRIADFVNGLSAYDVVGATFGGLPVGAGVSANENSITGSSGLGVDNSGTSETVDAEDNWWGAADGPSGAGPGSGDGISANVDADPFAVAVPACVNCTADVQCDDGLTCTGAETCNLGSGMCEAGTAVVCSDQCETGVCLEPGTCELQPDGFVCSATPDSCTLDDTCQVGVCTDGGGGDGDADGVCNADDNCPVDANPGQDDIDGDTIGDVCDLDDGPSMNVNRAILKRQRKPDKANGSVLVKGDFIANPDTLLTTSATITVKVEEAFGFDRIKIWDLGTECKINVAGRVTCKSLDRTLKAAFRPFRKTPGVFRFKMNFKKQAIPVGTLFAAPVVVTVSFGPTPPAIGSIDRVGEITDCQATSRGIKCRE